MNVPKNLPSILSVLAIVSSIVGFAFSPVSAAVLNQPSVDAEGTAPYGYGIHGITNTTLQAERLQAALTQLSQKGVDVSQAQADFTSGNLTATIQWLREYMKANPGTSLTGIRTQRWNSTLQTARLQSMLTNLSQQGVDVSQAQTDLTAGNTTAALQWLHQYLKTNPSTLVKMNGGQSAGNTAWKGGLGFVGRRPSHHAWNTGNAA